MLVNISLRNIVKIKFIKILVFLLLVLSCVGSAFAYNNTLEIDAQRTEVYNVGVDGSLDYTMNMVYSNSNDELVKWPTAIFSQVTALRINTVTMSAWDAKWGLYQFDSTIRTSDYGATGLVPGTARLCKYPMPNSSYFVFSLIANIGELEFPPQRRYVFTEHLTARNFTQIESQNELLYYPNQVQTNSFPDFCSGFYYFEIIGMSIHQLDGVNLSKNTLIVTMPQDSYYYSDSIQTYPYYDSIMVSPNGKTSLVWDLTKMSSNMDDRKIVVRFKIKENELKKDLDEATMNSLYLGRIALIISLISLFISLIPSLKGFFAKK